MIAYPDLRSICVTTRAIEQHLLRLRARYLQASVDDALPRLLEAWLRHASPQLRARGRPSFCDGREALIDMDSSVWLARLRQEQDTLCRQLRETPGLEQLQRVRGRVREAPLAGPAANRRRATPMPAAARTLFGEMAAHVTDPALKRSLEQLGRGRPASPAADAADRQTPVSDPAAAPGSIAGKNQG